MTRIKIGRNPRFMSVEIDNLPGFHIRRLQQIAVAVFLEETQATGITPVQYAALYAVGREPGIDQRTLARAIALDASTTGGVVDRLEARGWLQRRQSPQDRRVRLLFLSEDGQQGLAAATPAMLRTQERILEALNASERAEFVRLLSRLVAADPS